MAVMWMARRSPASPGAVPLLRAAPYYSLSCSFDSKPSPPAAATGHDYFNYLHKSTLFFEGQHSSRLPPDQRVRWRYDSALWDGASAGIRGCYDAGDNVKFGFPMAFTTTLLSWSIIDFGRTMGPDLPNAVKAVWWGTDYLLEATSIPGVVFVQVGNPYSDHNCWERPEDKYTLQTACTIDRANARETAAALAAASIVFQSRDPVYRH